MLGNWQLLSMHVKFLNIATCLFYTLSLQKMFASVKIGLNFFKCLLLWKLDWIFLNVCFCENWIEFFYNDSFLMQCEVSWNVHKSKILYWIFPYYKSIFHCLVYAFIYRHFQNHEEVQLQDKYTENYFDFIKLQFWRKILNQCLFHALFQISFIVDSTNWKTRY